MVSAIATSLPSTVSRMPPRASSRSPVAVTTMSASSSAPDLSLIPVSVNSAIWSVTTSARPLRMAAKKSPSGARHMRWSHGL